jgi:predicted tellurium resistance membrane protein TerC
MSTFLSVDGLLGLATLTLMEIVLGIDNIVFIAILVTKLPASQQQLARRLGLTLALGIRVLLLLTISWVMGLTKPLVTLAVLEVELSGRSLILLAGGIFLIVKATREIYEKVEGGEHESGGGKGRAAFGTVIVQILLLDVVFSLDSVITAIGMSDHVPIMITAMVIAMLVMLASAGPVSGFVERHPSVKILALSFLLLIGVMLVAEGMGTHMSKGYVYFAMAFSLFVEMLNMRYRRRRMARRIVARPRA